MKPIVSYESGWRRWLLLLCIAAGYFLLARISLLLSFQDSNATPVWPPSGLAFALILLFGVKVMPAIFIGAFAANVVVFQQHNAADISTTLWVSCLIGIGNSAEAFTGWWLARKKLLRHRDDNYFNDVNSIFRFVLIAVLMCLVSSVTGTTAVYAASVINDDAYFTAWLTWWLGDVSGILLFTPAILVWIKFLRQPSEPAIPLSKRYAGKTETLVLFLFVVLASGIVFDNWLLSPPVFRWAFWVFPVVVWASIRFKQHEAVAAILVCSVISTWGTINGHGPFSYVPTNEPEAVLLNESLLILQSFTCIVSVSALVLNTSVNERRRTEGRLMNMGNELEKRVTERTVELMERNRFIETLFDAVEDLMAVFDKQGNYMSVNKKVEEIYGLAREKIIGKNVTDIFPALKNSEMMETLQKVISSGETIHHMSYRSVVTKRYYENFYIPLKNERQEVYGVLVIGHDNTAIMEAGEKIELVNTQLTEAQRLAHIGNWEWDIQKDKITWSDELYRIYGLTPRESEPSFENYLAYIHPDDKKVVSDIVQGAFNDQQPFQFNHRILRRDGITRILHGRGKVVPDEKGQPKSMSGTAQDITELKEAEEEIRKISDELLRYNKELEQTNKELESFTYVASHDLQEPIRKIQTFLSLVTGNETDHLSDSSKDYLERTIRAAAQMQTLINDLLLYSRTTSSADHFQKTDLNAIARNVTQELKEMIEEKQADIEIQPLPVLNVIPFQLQQFITNMLSNSLKFCSDSRKPVIRIAAGLASPGELEAFDKATTKKYHRISISDNGIGFDGKYNERIFDMFQRLHNRNEYKGTGIGLAICKKIVDNHGGFIVARGEPGKGAKFVVYLPEREMEFRLEN